MMAKRSGAERVYACEVSDAMVSLSREALAANGLADSVTVLHSLSTMLSIPKGIPNRYSYSVVFRLCSQLSILHVENQGAWG
jgi:predicted O-methyltransferase YrrM